MKGTVLLLLCAATLAQADQPQLTLSGKVCNCNPAEANNVCSQNGSDDQLIAHENCNQFYKCFHGSAVAYDCPANLLYSPLAEICDWPENVDCGIRPIGNPDANVDCSQENSNNSNEEQDNNGGTGDGNNGGTCNCNPEEAPAICAADGSDGVLVAHQNCNQFYKCDHGVPAVLNCPSGLVYNPYSEQCDWPHNVECGDRPIVEIEGGGNNNGGDEDCEDSGNGNGSGGGSGGNGDNGGTCNCKPEEAPGICGAAGSDGVLVAHENCNQFYKCSYGQPVALFCPEGLLYDPHKELCNWPAEVDCGNRPIVEGGGGNGDNGGGDNGGGDNGGGDNGGGDNGGGSGTCNCNPEEAPGICGAAGSDGVLVAHENCNQFYKCSHGQPVALFCPEGLLYDPHKELCNWPAEVDCGNRPIVEGGGGNGDNGGGDNGGGDNGGGDNGGGDNGGGSGTCNCNPEEAPGICGAAGSDGVLVAHENCNQFYKCSHGQPVALFCPEGLLYDPHKELCNWPAEVDCGNRPIVEGGGGNGDNGGGDNGGGDNGGGDNGGGGNGGGSGTCNCNPEEAPGICGAAGSDGVLVAHENCNQFYKCSHGQPVALFCPEGLLYDPYKELCNWPAEVDCGNRPIVEGGGGNGDNGGGDNGGGDNGGGDNGGGDNGGNGNNCDPSEAPAICSASGSDGVLVAHENCNQFYKCAEGVPVALDCPPGLLYNSVAQVCDWPHNVECGDRVIPDNNGGGDNGGGDNGGGDNGGGDNGGGDNGGGDNGGGSGTCNCNPEEASGICGAAGSDGVLVAHENCNQFYKCSHGQPVALFCPEGLLYDPHKELCNWPAEVDCGNRPIVEGGGGNGDNGGGDNGGGDNGGGDNGGGDNGGNGNNCDPSEAPAICSASGSDGVLVAHENCNQFYKCAEGVPVALDCPSGLFYNSVAQVCDWPHNVECGDRVIPDNNGGGDNGGGDNGGGDNGGGDNGGGSGTCNCNPEEAPGICGAAGSDGVLVAHENCNQFYKCSHGQPVALFCPEGLLYDPHKELCNWPAEVDCGNRPIVEGGGGNGDNGGGDNGGGDNGGGDNGGGDNGGNGNNCNPSEAPAICSASGSDGVLVAHENCNQFYKCAEGVPVALDCPPGLFYNSVAQVCDWPHNVECGDRVIPDNNDGGDNGGGDNGGGDNGGGDNGGGSGTCNCNPEEAPGICGAAGSDGVLVAHENCNQFYKCSHGQPVALFCPEGLLYDPHKELCNWPAQVDCGNRPIVEGGGGNGDNGGGDNGGGDNGGGDNGGGDNGGNGNNCDPSEAPAICSASGSDGVLVAHENCNQFYKCAEGVPVALDCPSGLLYNSVAQVCDWPHNVECGDRVIPDNNGGGDNGGGDNGGGGGTCNCNPEKAPGICSAASSDGVLVAHENCNQFYKCAHGVPVAQFCNPTLLYNPFTERCDWPHEVDCGNRPIVEVGGGNGDNGSGDNGGSDNGGGDSGGNSDNCDPSQAPAICSASGSDGVLVAHENCDQFYKCSEGVPVALDCPPGLFYNSIVQVCDWPLNVECGDRVIPDSNGGEDNNGNGDNNGGEDNNGNGSGGGNSDPSEAPAICANSGSNGVLIAHENCDQFYVCSYGKPVALNCPSNLLYNPAIEQCDWPRNVDCGGRVVPAAENDGGDNGPCSCNAREAPSICASSNSNGKLIAHENCNQYYVCFERAPVARSCPLSLFYDPHTERCLWPASVSCEGRAITSVSTYASLNKHIQARRGFF